MELNTLLKITEEGKKRLGLGHGSGRGKTAGRGTKGQKARGKVSLGFEGGQLPLIKRLPYKKGFKSLQTKPLIFNVEIFNSFEDGTHITSEKMVEWGLVPLAWEYGIKILGDGQLSKKIVVQEINCSKGAVKKIEMAGGKVEGIGASRKK